jgi:hypothetical protein
MQYSMSVDNNFRALEKLTAHLLADQTAQKKPVEMLVPDILIDPEGYSCRYVTIEDGRGFLLDAINRLRSITSERPIDNHHAEHPGPTCLIDLRSQATVNGRRGTFLSLIPWIAYFVCDLGCRNVVLLPLGPYGSTRIKGTHGSLFSLTDHMGLDQEYADPLVPQLCAREQYRAVVETAADAGVRVGAVQALATAALDTPALARDPSLTFWWAADPSEVLFAPVLDWMTSISSASADAEDEYVSFLNARPALPRSYTERFVEPPSRSSIRLVQRDEGIYWVGKSLYKRRMVDVAIANAIPDVIPDKADHYAWRDIALLNYWQTHIPCPAMLMGFVAHDTKSSALRMMKSVMRARSRRYGESLFWIDMARCLPAAVRESAPQSTPIFSSTKVIYEQITGNKPKWANSSGSVVGEFLCDIAPRAATRANFRSRLFSFLSSTGVQERQNSYLVGPGTHDALAAEPRVAAMLIILAYILPGAQLLIVSGHERFSSRPINVEFGDAGIDAYDEFRMSLFSYNPKGALSGLSASSLAEEHDLPPMSRLLGPAVLLEDYVRQCRSAAPPTFVRKRINTSGPNEIGYWTAGPKPNGPWCTVVLRIDDGNSALVKWEKDWKIVLQPMVSGGLQVQDRGKDDVILKPIDLIIIGGNQMADKLKT